MDQSPLIDVEAGEAEANGRSGCGGCLAKLVPLLVIFLFLSILGMGAAWVFLGGAESASTAEGGAAGEQVEEKTGFAGFLDKARQVLRGGSAEEETLGDASGTVEEGMVDGANKQADLAQSIGADAKTPEGRNQKLQDLAQQQGLDSQAIEFSSEIPDKLPDSISEEASPSSRGGSFGTTIGESRQVREGSDYMIWSSNLATAGSDLNFEVIFKEMGGQLHYRCFLFPHDSQTTKYFRKNQGDLLLSFHSRGGDRLLPNASPSVVPLSKMTAYESKGKVAGWVARGVMPLESVAFDDLKSVQMSWDLDKELGEWLQILKKRREQ